MSTAAQLRAFADPLRMPLLDLVLERAATVAELAEAVGRPKSTVAHHVGVLVDAGLMRVVRTRRVCAVNERFYGRTGRAIYTSVRRRPGDTGTPVCINGLSRRSGVGPGARGRRPAHDPATRPDPAREGGGVLGAGR